MLRSLNWKTRFKGILLNEYKVKDDNASSRRLHNLLIVEDQDLHPKIELSFKYMTAIRNINFHTTYLYDVRKKKTFCLNFPFINLIDILHFTRFLKRIKFL